MNGPAAPEGRRAGRWKPVVLIAAVLTMLVVAYLFDVGSRFAALRGWIEGLGSWGPVVFVGLYATAVVAALPGSALTVLAGALFGSVKGVIVVSAGSTLGASLAFLVGRYFARDAVASWLSGQEKFARLDRLTRERGAVIVAFTRLVPLFPFNLLNYGFGLTGVRFWTYVFWSWLCMLPGTVLYVVGTDAVVKGVSEGRAPWLLIGVTAAAAGLLALIVRWAKRGLGTEGEGENS